jgi:hypothetical protein
MTGPIDVAYVQLEPEFTGFAQKVKAELNTAFAGLSRDIDRGGAGGFANLPAAAGEAGRSAGREFADGFTRDASGRLHDARGRFVSEFGGMGAAATEGLSGATQAFTRFASLPMAASKGLGAFGSAAATMGSVVMFAIPPIVALSAALVQLLGLLAAVPAAAAVAGALILPAVIGFSGFTDALKKTSTAGGGAVDTLSMVEDAEYRLAQAQRSRARASDDVARATQNATRELEDLQTAVARGAGDEQEAQLAVVRAFQRTRNTRGLDRLEAQLAYRDAVDNLEDIRTRNRRNADDLAEAQKKGVQGSDQVVSAREAEANAIRAVAEAQQALNKAQQGSGGGGGVDAQQEALNKLAPAAREVAEELIGLQPRFDAFRRGVQQALFEPLIGDATKFTDVTLPHIQAGMEKVAGSIGRGLSGFIEKLSTPQAGEFFDKVFASADRVIGKLGPGVERLFEAIGRGTEAGLPFIEEFAGQFGDALETFGAFIIEAVEDGRFQKWIEDGAAVAGELFDIIKDLGGLFKELFTEENAAVGMMILEGIKGIIELVTGGVATFNDFQEAGEEAFIAIVGWVQKVSSDIDEFFGAIPEKAKQLRDNFVAAGKHLISGFFSGLKDVGGFIGGLASSVGGAIRGVMNDVLVGFNSAIQDVDNVLPFSLPRIPMLAQGGMAIGPTLAGIGEGGRNEVILPLGDPRTISALQAAGMGGDGGQTIVFEAGAIAVGFDGAVPSEADARRTGQAVGLGIADVLSARNVRTQVRTL